MAFESAVSVVTGGASGIGRALCWELARRGGKIVVADINRSGAEAVAADIRERGGSACAIHVDVRQAHEVESLVDSTLAQFGRLDYFFNNAGMGVGGEIHELTLDQWRSIIDVNLMGVVYGVAAAYPVMLRQGSGHIVNIASLAGLVSSPGLGPYATTKGAVVSLTNALRVEAETRGVRASVACPGFVDTAIFDNAIGIKLHKHDLLAKMRLPLMPVRDAALEILRGVERNQGVIVFPGSARMLWRMARFGPPWLLTRFHRRMAARLRTVRRVEADSDPS